jgi:hypothetical protein
MYRSIHQGLRGQDDPWAETDKHFRWLPAIREGRGAGQMKRNDAAQSRELATGVWRLVKPDTVSVRVTALVLNSGISDRDGTIDLPYF